MDKIIALITLIKIVLAKRLIMKSSSVIPSLIFDLILSFSSGVVSIYSSSSPFLCSSRSFIAHPSVQLGESQDSRVFSLVPPM